MNRPTARSNRPGFTMVELLVVIVIIALLLALLLPAINGAVRSARNAAVSAEINQLAQALADFKSKYGDYPPSRMLLCEDGWFRSPVPSPATSASDVDISAAALVQRSVAYMRKFWPRVAITTTGPALYPDASGKWLDFNGTGGTAFNGTGGTAPDPPYILQGHECLVFFLGGIRSTSGVGVTGFARNPQNPFLSDSVAPNRQPPLFEFDASRLALSPPIPGRQPSQIPGYYDSLKTNRFYAYFSAYGGNSYDPNDVNFDLTGDPMTESDANAVSPITLNFLVNFAVSNATNPNLAVSAPPNPYTSTQTIPTVGSVTFQKPQSFQIISAGADGEYGVGGLFTPSSSTPLPNQSGVLAAGQPTNDTDLRSRERDNITNFYNSKLD
jgi:prepilin-type N-terminal cleavage/methylation domain-containing protein